MATLENNSNSNQQTWVPYETTKDCSLGFCSIYCPQWCYILFPPPPPTFFEDGPSGTGFSPLVIAIIGILASAFLLVSYYTVISKYCGRLEALRQRHVQHSAGSDDEAEDNPPGNSRRHEGWHVSPSNGLDEVLINKIAVCRYKRGDGLVDGTDCSVCLGEFQEDESLRLLPKCSHAFHVQCIDTWLKSHSNCPLCRANVISVTPAPPPHLPAPPLVADNPPELEAEHHDEMVVVMAAEESSRGGEEDNELGCECDPPQDNCDQGGSEEEGHCIVEIRDEGIQPMRRSFSTGSSHRSRVSIADVLRMSMEDEILVAKENGLLSGCNGAAGPSRRCGGDHGKGGGRSRGLHCVMSPVPMKRSLSSGRFCFTRNGRGRSSVLPL